MHVTEPSQAMADPVANAVIDEPAKPETTSADFTESTTVNMWDNIRTENNSDADDSDMPAILRRRKKNKD